MKKIVDYFTWGFLIIFFIPCVLIVASWDAVPGDSLFGIKLGLERAAVLAFFPSYASQGGLEIEYTERRFKESQKLLSTHKSTVESEQYLRQQIITTRDIVLKSPDRATRRTLARQAAAKFQKIEQQIKREQQANPLAYAQQIQQTAASAPSTQSQINATPTQSNIQVTPIPTTAVTLLDSTTNTPMPSQDPCGANSTLSTSDFLNQCGRNQVVDSMLSVDIATSIMPTVTPTAVPTTAPAVFADPCGEGSTLSTEQFLAQCGTGAVLEGMLNVASPTVTGVPADPDALINPK